jgi:DNA (cytosine-5)-methyltransferase 1
MSYIEVFAGAGGMSVGLEKAGWTPILLVDNDKKCIDTLKLNNALFPNCEIRCEDVTKLSLVEYKGRFDLLVGGVPCQSFSQAGKRKGLADARGNLFNDFIRLVDESEPNAFLIENVEGLTTHDNGETFRGIVDRLKRTSTNGIEYKITHKLLNANDYGVAQKRKRVFIVGIRTDLPDDEFTFPQPLPRKPVLRDALQDVPVSPGVRYPAAKVAVMEHVPPGGCWVDLPEDVKVSYMKNSLHSGGGKRGIARRIAWDEPCLTLTTSPCQKQTERCHPDEARPFTVREYARIQSFPDSYKFAGSVASQYKQIGNAVACEVAYHVGKELLKVIHSPSPSP